MGVWIVNELQRELCPYTPFPKIVKMAEHVRGNTNEDRIKQKFEEFTGIAFDDFLLLDAPNSVALPDDSSILVCPCKYMLYSDPFVGFLDSTVKLGEGQKYRIYAEQLHNVVKKVASMDMFLKLWQRCARFWSISMSWALKPELLINQIIKTS